MGRIRVTWGCKIEGCKKIHLAKGYCHNHYCKHGQLKKCKVSDCDLNHHAKGYCVTHYTRLRKNGNQIVSQRWGKDYTSLEDYLKKNHAKNSDGCWVWTGNFSRKNYGFVGNFSLAKKLKIYMAHRLSFFVYKGEIPNGMLVCHKCDNPSCINPEHLFLGTHEDNMRDMDSKGRRRVHKGENSVKAKLTKEQAIYILQNMETISAWDLSTKFNVSRQTIQNVWNGITKYIEPELREKIINKEYCQVSGAKLDKCQHESSGAPHYLTDQKFWNVCDKCNQYFIRKCEHESDGLSYMTNPPQNKCLKCGEFYR